MSYRLLPVVLVIASLVGCGAGDSNTTTTPDVTDKAKPIAENVARIETQRLSAIVKVLASDEFEGRAPGTPGGRKTVKFLIEKSYMLINIYHNFAY